MGETAATVSNTLWARGLKRVFDVIMAIVLLVVLSPVLVAAAVAVKITSRGPLFFVQERSGRGRRRFRITKFRTMRGGRTPDPKELVPLDHPEITPVGRVLRRTKIDELPQMINVLFGQMSFVGPRPDVLGYADRLEGDNRIILTVRPGITGPSSPATLL